MDTPTTTTEVIGAMLVTLAEPSSWTQHQMARDASGDPCPPTSPEARCWCLYGARARAVARTEPLLGLEAEQSVIEEVDDLLHDATNGAAVAIFNDDPLTTHADVIALLSQALSASKNACR